MGQREKRIAAKRANSIQLDELDYLRLVQARGKIDAAMLAGQRVVQEAEKTVQAAREEAVTVLKATAAKYKFDPRVNHHFDDKHFRLIPEGE